MIYLPDVNIWIALTSDRHVHRAVASSWFRSVESGQVAFCRITQLGLLRLLTNSHVMEEDVLIPTQAWRVYDDLRADPRIVFLNERPGFSVHWRKAGEQITGGPNVWTDAYLAAFASHTQATVMTFNRRFGAAGKCSLLTLQPQS